MSALSLADAKSWLNITVTTYDTKLQAVIDSAEAVISQRCGALAPTATTSRVRGNGSPALVLPTCPVVNIASISASDGSTVLVSDVYLDQDAGVITRNDEHIFTARHYDIAYLAGRSEVPADLLEGIKELVRHLWVPQRGAGTRPGSPEPEGASNRVPGAGYLLPFRVQELIAPHERAA